MAIDLNLNEQQQLIQNSAHDFFERHCPSALVRQYLDNEEEFPRGLWRKMAEMGWLGMPFAAQYDGLECSFLDMYVLYIEMGRCLLPSPHLDTVALAGTLVSTLGGDAQKQRVLPAIASGETIATLAVMEPEGVYGAQGIALRATRKADGFVLSGTKVLVPYMGSADWLVVAARTGSGAAEDSISLFLIDPRMPGIRIERTPSMAGLPLYAVTFDNVAVAAGDALGDIDRAWPVLHETMMKAAVLQAAMVVGAGERVLDISVGYAKDRVQFGEPIGKYQFVQQLVTEVAIQGHNAGLLALHAAWRIDAGLPFLREAALAKAGASKASAAMTFAAHEVHAGIGFMIDYDLQLYTQRGKYWETNLGDARYHLDRAVAEHHA